MLARLLLGAFAYLATTATQASVARACPDCALGRAARSQVWNEDFAFNLGAALVPFVFMIAVSVWADRIGRPSSNRP